MAMSAGISLLDVPLDAIPHDKVGNGRKSPAINHSAAAWLDAVFQYLLQLPSSGITHTGIPEDPWCPLPDLSLKCPPPAELSRYGTQRVLLESDERFLVHARRGDGQVPHFFVSLRCLDGYLPPETEGEGGEGVWGWDQWMGGGQVAGDDTLAERVSSEGDVWAEHVFAFLSGLPRGTQVRLMELKTCVLAPPTLLTLGAQRRMLEKDERFAVAQVGLAERSCS
jgi:hypothetical protein